MTTRIVAIRVIVDGPRGVRDRHVVGWLPTGWFCDQHPGTRTCQCRQLLAEHLTAHRPAPTDTTGGTR